MKRIACLIVLTALSSPASARNGYSFVIRGHHVRIPAHCRALSCISVSGMGTRRRGRQDGDVATLNEPAPAPVALPAPAAVIAPPPPPAQPVYSPPSPAPPPPSVGFETPKPGQGPVAQPREPAKPVQPQDKPVVVEHVPSIMPPVARVAQNDEEENSPIVDWQTEGKNGLVRIESCGAALCGYMLNATTKARGETILVNMKPKKTSQWAGSVYSRSSGNSYYGTMTLKEGTTLRVEACALGSFFCSGNNWTRFEDSRSLGHGDIANSHQDAPQPRS